MEAISIACSRVYDPLLPPPQIISRFAVLRSFDDFTTRISAAIFVGLAGIALLLALAGVYGVVAYGVERRTHEFGVRRSLGAQGSAIAFGVIREVLLLGAAGIAAGAVLGAFAARALAQVLYQTAPLDPLTFGAAAVFLLGAIALAAWVPARRAARVQPATALRYE